MKEESTIERKCLYVMEHTNYASPDYARAVACALHCLLDEPLPYDVDQVNKTYDNLVQLEQKR